MIPPGQATIAVVGLTPALTLDMPFVGTERARKIADIEKEIQSLARSLVYDELPRKIKMPRPWSYEALVKRFETPLTAADLEHITGRFSAEAQGLVPDFLATLQSTFALLSSELPVSHYQTYNGPRQVKPPSDAIWKWYSRYWVLSDPLVTFPLMQTGALLPDQAKALEEDYPELYQSFDAAVRSAMAWRAAKDPKFMNLSPTTDRGVGVLLKKKLVAYGTNVPVSRPEAKAPPVNRPAPKLNPALQTAGQRSDGI